MTETIDNQKLDEFLSNLGTPEPGPSKDDKTPSDSTLSDDFDQVWAPVVCKLNPKLPYSYQEDKEILKFVLKGQNIFKVFSISLWKNLEAKKMKPKRTFQSLKNRFLRNIKPKLFTAYKHLIEDQDTVEKILIKFPELKKQLKGRKTLTQINQPEPERNILKNLNSNQPAINTDDIEISQTNFPTASGNFEPSSLSSSIPQYLKTSIDERTIKINDNKIKISIDTNKNTNRFYPILAKLTERFKNLEKNNEREQCLACGRFYGIPSSESSDDSDIPNSYPVETDENYVKVKEKMNESNRSRHSSSCSESLLSCLKNPEKLGGSAEETDDLPVVVAQEVDDVEIVKESPRKETKNEIISDIKSDFEIFYDARIKLEKLLGDEKPVLAKCMNGIDLSSFNEEESLDSCSLETPPGTPLGSQ